MLGTNSISWMNKEFDLTAYGIINTLFYF
jgi:hypothetical protein